MQLQARGAKIASALLLGASVLLADSTLDVRSTRLDSMELNSYMTKDRFDIFFNPANTVEKSAGIFLEVGGLAPTGGADAQDSNATVNALAGAIYRNKQLGAFGLVLNRYNTSLERFNHTVMLNALPIQSRQNSIDLLYGAVPLKGLKVGARISYTSSQREYKDSTDTPRVLVNSATYSATTTSSSSNDYSLDAKDITLQLGAKYKGFDAVVAYSSYLYDAKGALKQQSLEYNATTLDATLTSKSDNSRALSASGDGAMMLQAALAYNYKLNEQADIRGYGVYTASNYSEEEQDNVDNNLQNIGNSDALTHQEIARSQTHTFDELRLGAALNYKPKSDLLVVVAAEYRRVAEEIKVEDEIKSNYVRTTDLATNSVTMQYNPTGIVSPSTTQSIIQDELALHLAAQGRVSDRLVLRFGLREPIYYNLSNDSTTKKYDTTYVADDKKVQSVNDSTTTLTTSTNAQPDMSLGVGFGYKAADALTLDALVNADLFLSGPSIITGSKLDHLNARLALNYTF